jgi:HSP20 family protein
MNNEVFVVGDLLNTAYYNTGLTNTGGIGTLTTGGLTLTNGTTNLHTLTYHQPTYNDFWNFDEQFDLLWKSFFDHNATFKPVREKVVNHPCDIQETDNGLRIEIAAVGLDKEDIDIIVDSETLRIAHRKTEEDKQKEQDEYRYLHRSIKKASFDIAWKISSKYELTKLDAKLDKGLLTLDIPFAKENKPKKISIK